MTCVKTKKKTRDGKKQAILFGGTDGHGVAMTAISENNLIKDGYAVDRNCCYEKSLPSGRGLNPCKIPKDSGTGDPEFFWAGTFCKYDYSDIGEGDVIVVVDIPLPIKYKLDFSAADAAIEKIRELCSNKIRVLLIDHHKRALTHYGEAIKAGAEVCFSLGSQQYCHYGNPDKKSLFWGTVGAICDRDTSTIPIEEWEKPSFKNLERYAKWLDSAVRYSVDNALTQILNDNRKISKNPDIPSANCKKRGNISYIENLDSSMWGYKQLDFACETNKTPYGVGILQEEDLFSIIVITYWKSQSLGLSSLPVALKLPHHRSAVGHDMSLKIKVASQNLNDAKALAEKFISIINSDALEKTTTFKDEPDAIDYISRLFKNIPTPFYLTMHGWNHIETVFANAQLLGAFTNLSSHEQTLLNWSALFHDIGNGAMEYKKKYHLIVENDKEARKNHHIYTVEILRNWDREGLFKKIVSSKDLFSICVLCWRHRKDVDLPSSSGSLDCRKLSSLLRIADGLDKTRSRARQSDKQERYSVIKPRLLIEEPESIKHWEGQRAIESIRLTLSKDQILFEFLVSNRRKAKFIINDFKDELDRIPPSTMFPQSIISITDVPKKAEHCKESKRSCCFE